MPITLQPIRFNDAEKDAIVDRIRRYFTTELSQDIGRFDASFLLDFFPSEIGMHCYNRGLRDAQAALAARIDDVQDAIAQLEKPTDAPSMRR